ncbi:helicase [Dietzia alimentaria]|nr:helicase [Dietzia alimentaria]
MSAPLPDGLYESVITPRLQRRLDATTGSRVIAELDPTLAPEVLGRHVGDAVRRHLESVDPTERLEVAKRLLDVLNSEGDDLAGGSLLQAVYPPGKAAPRRPSTPLSEGALLTNARDEPGLGNELALEMESADEVDLLCAFVKFTGVTVLAPQFELLAERGRTPRVLTTTYMGATDRRALDVLVKDYGARVKVRFEKASTRLHAKAWLFRRQSGFDTAYVGSSNLSRAALVDGLEWNVRLSSVAHAAQIAKFRTVFDSYWNLADFELYNPDTDAEKLDRALEEAGGRKSSSVLVTLSGLEVRPFGHQQLMLDALATEREVFDHHRNLLIAATGTGKTVVAALDYRALSEQADGRLPTLLFVAHRKEILVQALRTYRAVLGDGSFGELFVGGERPRHWKHVFASVQSLNRDQLVSEEWDVLVIDEFHHAESASYRRLLSSITAGEVLGLTATPERADGVDVRELFDGRTAYELRLWDALEQDLLCPFHYYGISDNTDLRDVEWTAGQYSPGALSDLYTGNDARTLLVIKALREKVLDPTRMRALGFCVTVDHAKYMAEAFTARGLPSAVIVGTTDPDERRALVERLRSGDLRCIFTVDVFNEGVDIPSVDVVLMLRPTASSTVFIQQLGRGLRRSPGKAVLIVLDFVGQHRADFDLAGRFHAMTGLSRRRLESDLDVGFPSLPGASRIVLDEVSQDEVLRSIKAAVKANSKNALAKDLRSLGAVPRLAEFLDETNRELADVYRTDRSWTTIVSIAAGKPEPDGQEKKLLKRLQRLRTVDDLDRIREYTRVSEGILSGQTFCRDDMWASMLIDYLLPSQSTPDFEHTVAELATYPRLFEELVQLMEASTRNIHHVPLPLDGNLADLPLRSHASYNREELLSALDWRGKDGRPQSSREGVAWSEIHQTDIFFINLHKDERVFSPSTMYRDVPVSPTLFDWESQSNTSQESKAGRRYLAQRETGTNVLLAVRNSPKDDVATAPFVLLGNADYVSHSGERPIQIRWELRRPMPVDVLAQASALGI